MLGRTCCEPRPGIILVQLPDLGTVSNSLGAADSRSTLTKSLELLAPMPPTAMLESMLSSYRIESGRNGRMSEGDEQSPQSTAVGQGIAEEQGSDWRPRRLHIESPIKVVDRTKPLGVDTLNISNNHEKAMNMIDAFTLVVAHCQCSNIYCTDGKGGFLWIMNATGSALPHEPLYEPGSPWDPATPSFKGQLQSSQRPLLPSAIALQEPRRCCRQQGSREQRLVPEEHILMHDGVDASHGHEICGILRLVKSEASVFI